MKKIIALVLIAVLMLTCLVGCGGTSGGNLIESITKGDVKAKIVNNDGETEYLSTKELLEIKESNEIAFKKKYWCAQVEVEGEVAEISSSHTLNGTAYAWTITVEGGKSDWFLGKEALYGGEVEGEEILSTLKVGDKVRLFGEIVGVDSFDCNICNGTNKIEKVE